MDQKVFDFAVNEYAKVGVNVQQALNKLSSIALSLHAWQGDDVVGFESTAHALTGGCQVTGTYPGRARTADELRADLEVALKLIPGTHRICLQAHQIDKVIPNVDRDKFSVEQFATWISWAKAQNVKLDIAPVFYSHPKLDNGLSLSHPDENIRKFWINHGKAIRNIAAVIGKEQNSPCVCNFWMPDGFKDIPADRKSPRERMRDSLDEIFAEVLPKEYIVDAVEPKLFGIGTESYTVGSNEFYTAYAVTRQKMLCLDSGHFHPTETISDKLSSIFCFMDEILLHVSRGVRWDSDHVILLNDDLMAIAQEITRYDYMDRVHIGLDYFDASINRVAAMVIGAKNMLKALLIALLEPRKELCEFENVFNNTGRMALMEEAKTLPYGIIWDYYCEKNNVPQGMDFMTEIRKYEQEVLFKRN